MKRQLAVAWLVALTLLIIGAGGVMAQTGTGLLLLKVDGEDLNAEQKAAAGAGIKATLEKYNKYKVVEDATLDLLEAMVDFECLDVDAACLAAVGGKYNVDLVLYTSVSGGKLSMILVDAKTKAEVKRDEKSGDKATLIAAIPDASVQALFGPLAKPKPERLVFKVEASEEGATVLINNKKIGASPISVKLKPGKYSFEVKKKGFLAVKEQLTVEEDEGSWKPVMKPVPAKVAVVTPPEKPVEKPVEKPKDPEKKVGDDDDTPFYATWWFWTGVGVAVVAGTTTAIVLATDGSSDAGVGTTKFTMEPSSAQYDAIFYR